MNVLIDLGKCREYMSITIGGIDHKVKLSGTFDDPYFCGRDVCDVLGYKDPKQALQKHVKPRFKKELNQFKKLDVDLTSNFLGSENHKVSYHEGKAVYINEPGLYTLIMNSNTPLAEKFQDMVYETILPSIRKYGSCHIESQLSLAMEQLVIKDISHEEETKELQNRLDQEKLQKEKLEIELEQQRLLKEQSESEAKERLQRVLKFNQATKQVEPQEYMYIATTEDYSQENKFKPGGCASFDLTKSRLNQYNSGKSDSNSHFFTYIRKVANYRAIEQALQSCLGGFRENANKELYIINYDWLVRCIDAIIDHNMEFLAFVNLNRDQMFEDTLNKKPVSVVPLPLEKIRISLQRVGEDEVEVTTILDQDVIDAIMDSMVLFNPDNNIVKRVVFEDHLKQHHPEVKLDHKKRIIWDIVKKIGVSINPKWRYKY